MENFLLIAISLLMCFGLFTGWLLVKAILREYNQLKNQFQVYVSPDSQGGPSPLAKTLELLADMMARAILAQAKMFLMAQQSAANRAEYAETDRANPIGALIPRNLKRNPLVNILSNLIASKIGTSLIPPGSNHQEVLDNPPKFKL